MEPARPTLLPLWGWNKQQGIPLPEEWSDQTLLFRVWFDGPESVQFDPEHGFVAHNPYTSRSGTKNREIIYDHVDLKTQRSPYISTTLSLFWAMARAYAMTGSYSTKGKDIKISAIRASKLKTSKMFIALEHLPRESEDYPKAGKLELFADQSQEVLILNSIPANAVIATWSFQTELFKAPELPWIEHFDEPGKTAAWKYAENWASTFRDNRRFWDPNMHATRCLNLAIRLIDGDTSRRSVCNHILNLAAYLYRWPFRDTPPQSRSYPRLRSVRMPTRDEVMTRLNNIWDDRQRKILLE